MVVIEEFLPKALSAEELEALVRAVIAETGATSKKRHGVSVMKAAQAWAAGRAEGKVLVAWWGGFCPDGLRWLVALVPGVLHRPDHDDPQPNTAAVPSAPAPRGAW